MSPDRIAFMGVVGAITLVAAVIDIRTRRLPNPLTVSAFVLGLVFHLVVGFLKAGFPGLTQGLLVSVGGFAVGFGLLFLMWVAGSCGGGDVKLMGALGAWLGPMATIYVFLVGAIYVLLGSILTRVWASANRQRSTNAVSGSGPHRIVPGGSRPRGVVPWAVPLALAVWSVVIYSEFCVRK